MSNANEERRKNEAERINVLASMSSGKMKVLATRGNPINEIEILLSYVTVASPDYPKDKSTSTRLKISLPARYPLVPPVASISTQIYNPHVYSSGTVCLGKAWANEPLDLIVKRIVRIITYDATLFDQKSPANSAALNWYNDLSKRSPKLFPTDIVNFTAPQTQQKTMSWNTAGTTVMTSVIHCTKCKASLRVPSGKIGKIKCPNCNELFEARS